MFVRWLFIIVLFISNVSFSNTSKIKLEGAKENSKKVSFLRNYGELEVFVFKNGVPFPKAKIKFKGDKRTYKTNNDGMLYLRIPEGRHSIMVFAPRIKIEDRKFVIGEGEVTQVYIRLMDDSKNPAFLIENPFGVEAKLKAKELRKGKGHLKSGTLVGKVLNIKNKSPISGARIFVKGLDTEGISDKEGTFKIKLPEGRHTLSILHNKFSTQTLRDIRIQEGIKTKKEITLTASALELEEFVVIAPHVKGSMAALFEVRRKSSVVADVLGADQISKQGDSDAAGSLKRVTGLTLVGGKYIYVRGLGERYSSTYLNNSTLPSPEPMRRVVPLDIFPSGIIESMVIQKSYSPDLPAEFGGGSIKLITKSIPEKRIIKLSLSTNYDSDTFEDKVTYKGGGTDWLGMDDGTRELPESIRIATANNKELKENNLVYKDGYTLAQLAKFGRDMPNIWNTSQESKTTPPNLSLTFGDRYKIFGNKLGFILSGLYGNSWENNQKAQNSYNVSKGSTLVLDKTFDYDETVHKIKLGGLLNFGIEIGKNHKISTNGILIRKTTDKAQVREGYRSDEDTNLRETKLQWTERQLFSGQLSGSHKFPMFRDSLFEWRYTQSQAKREAPDERHYRYLEEKEGYRFDVRNDGNQRVFSALVDDNTDIGSDISLNIPWYTKTDLKLKMGYNYITKDRDSEIRRFSFTDKRINNTDINLTSQDMETIMRTCVKEDCFVLKESTRATDNYSATQKINATYIYGVIPLLDNLKFNTGMRYEKSVQDVKTFQLFDPSNQPKNATLETVDYLPIHSLTWEFLKGMQLRLSYSETISRPDFKELSASPFTDDERGKEVVGNENLQATVIKNGDFRYEWYFGKNQESLSLGVFYKEFERPIEAIIEPGTEGRITFENAESATNYGVEFEFKKNLGFFTRYLSPLTIAGNVAIIESQIKLNKKNLGIQTSNNRPLQGQSPYVYNVQLQYDNLDTGTVGTLMYNIF
ncbi:MAG: TonB-dependent receptor domain-containing protein [Bacteriovoracaceae bacterium]